MKYSESHKCWCVHPTQHNNYLHVCDWCNERWGWHKVDGRYDGTWSYCDGSYYGFTTNRWGLTLPDSELYFSFDKEEDAMMFALRWA